MTRSTEQQSAGNAARPGRQPPEIRRRIQEVTERVSQLDEERILLLEAREGLAVDERTLRGELDASQQRTEELAKRLGEAEKRLASLEQETTAVQHNIAGLELAVASLERRADELAQDADVLERSLQRRRGQESSTHDGLASALERLGRLGHRLRDKLNRDTAGDH